MLELNYILSIIALLFALYNIYFTIKVKKLKIIKMNEENKNNISNNTIELDKIIHQFIKEARSLYYYGDSKLLQRVCIDLFHLKNVILDEEKKEVINNMEFDYYSEVNFDKKFWFFTGLINKYIDKIEEYRSRCLEDDFEKIKKNAG